MKKNQSTEQTKAARKAVRARRKRPEKPEEIVKEARALAATKAKCEPISKKQLAVQEGLKERDVHRKLKLASLPQDVQTLVEQRKLPVLAAEHLAAEALTPNQRSALAAKIVDGRTNGDTRQAVAELVQVVKTWSPEALASFLADPELTFEQAREQHMEQERKRREQEQIQQRRASERRAGNKKLGWVAMDIIDHFNQTTKIIAMNNGRVDPMARQSAIDSLKDSLGNGLVALAVLTDRQTALHALQAAQNKLRLAVPVESGVPAGEVVPGEVFDSQNGGMG